jgi:hypothetical protein
MEATRGKKLTPADRMVLTYLAIRQGCNAECWPSLETISDDLGISKPTVLRAVNSLLGAALIEKTAGGPGRGHSHRYSVHLVKRSSPVTFSGSDKGQEALPLPATKRSNSDTQKVTRRYLNLSISNHTTSSASNIHFDGTTNRWVGIHSSYLADWREAYPGIDVERELLKSAIWWRDNPKKRRKDVRRFLTNWMSRAERGFPSPTAPAQSKREPQRGDFDWTPTIEELAKIDEECRAYDRREGFA